MKTIVLDNEMDFETWRREARAAALANVAPGEIVWQVGGNELDSSESGLFNSSGSEDNRIPVTNRQLTVPPAFIELCRGVIANDDSRRFDLLYRLLVRLQSEKNLLARDSDPDVQLARTLAGGLDHQETVKEPSVALDDINDLESLEAAIRGCRNCPLWEPATQAVCGQGPTDAALMLVGEQPGDQEDLHGKPFVGPAGQLLREVMRGIGLDPGGTYITNVVKHFKFEPRGKRRLHKNPSPAEIEHCRFWIMKEIELVAPRVIVAMGGSAYRGLTGEEAKVGQMRGRPMAFGQGTKMLVTYHPSYVLRVPSGPGQDKARQALADDLTLAKEMVEAA